MGGKIAGESLMAWMRFLGKGGGKAIGYTVGNAGKLFFGGGLVVGSATGEGAMNTWKSWLGGDEDTSVTKMAGDAFFGKKAMEENDDNVLLAAGQSVLGRDTMQHMRDGVENMRDRASQTYENLVAKYSQSEYDRYMQMQQYAGAGGGYPVSSGGGGGGESWMSGLSPFKSIQDLITRVTGGNTNMMAMASLIPAAMLMFGNFGWLGKIASLFLGNYALKSMRHGQQQDYAARYRNNYDASLATAQAQQEREQRQQQERQRDIFDGAVLRTRSI